MSSKGTANRLTASHPATRSWRFGRRLRRDLLVCLGALFVAPPLVASTGVAHAGPGVLNRLTGVAAKRDGAATTVRIQGSTTPRYSVVRSASPPQLRVDLFASELRGVPRHIDVGSPALRRIAVRQFQGRRTSSVRVSLELIAGAEYSVRVDGNAIVIDLRDAPLAKRTSGARKSAASPAGAGANANASAPTKRSAAKSRQVREISFEDHLDRSEIRVTLSGRTKHRLETAGGQPLLRLEGATLPKRLARKLDTSAFSGPVQSVASYSTGSVGQPQVCIRLALSADVPHRVRRTGNTLVWQVIKPTHAGPVLGNSKKVLRSSKKALDDSAVVASKTVIPAGAATKPDATQSSSAATRTYSFQPPRVAAGRGLRRRRGRSYAGRRIDLDFKDADIHNILRLLSDVGSVNIITSDAVSGKVTIRMKDVPWDQALDVILRAKGLGQVREGNLIRVAPLADLEKEREAEIARQKQIMLLQTLETRLIPLSYAQAEDVLSKLQYTLSPRGKVTFDKRTNMVIARDVPSNLDLLERMIRNLDTQTPQVMIEARIVEARTNYSRAIGIQWGAAFTASSATGNSTGLAFPNQVGIGGGVDDPQSPTQGLLLGQAANPNFVVNMPAATGLNSGSALGLTLGSVSGTFNLNLRLSAAESTGDIRIVSAPKVTTLDNVEARIEQGVSIPFSQVSANGVQTAFIDATLRLNVKPHVTADGSVIMKIKVERNEPDFVNTGARGDPTILKKQADTELLVKDGDTAVIGGIYTTRDGQSWQKVPWFAEIPILGWLFKTRRETSDREEVLVFITPRIINRAQSIGR